MKSDTFPRIDKKPIRYINKNFMLLSPSQKLNKNLNNTLHTICIHSVGKNPIHELRKVI